MKQNFAYDIPVHDIVLAMRSELEPDVGSMHFDLDVFDKGSFTVNFEYLRLIHIKPDQVISLFFFFFFLLYFSSFNWCIK